MVIKAADARLVRSASVLTQTRGFLFAFTHTLNPYMGCTFGDGGCGIYCYVAESPIGLYAGKPWGQWLRAKVNAAEALRRDLEQVADPAQTRIFMSSATDPYQPAESKLRITRSVLEVFRSYPVDLLVVQTRSPLVERDFDLLAAMPFAWLSMTVETDDDTVRRALPPTCPAIGRRLSTMRKARSLGIKVQAAVSPTLPNDTVRFADLLADSADQAIVDTFFGDGSNGKRTSRRPLPRRFADLGYGDWRDTDAAMALFNEVTSCMGKEHVGWSQEGFNRLAAEASKSGKLVPIQLD
jgi:DNA repair photolyase